jgi:hypothetical protein
MTGSRPPRKTDKGSTGARVVLWVALAAVLFLGGLLAARSLLMSREPAFLPQPCAVPCEDLVDSGIPKDGLPTLDAPEVMTPEEVDTRNEEERGKYLVSSDLVVGVRAGGEARAYPIRILNWHEIVNDTLGNVPIAVTFSPLTYGVAVFERRIGGAEVELGFSGRLLDSGQVFYDRTDDPSLWSQLLGAAVSGPASERGATLSRLPFSLTTWGDWQGLEPATTVLRPDPKFHKQYPKNPYGSYYQRGRLRFPVDPVPPEDGPDAMARVLGWSDDGVWNAVVLGDESPAVEVPGLIIEGETFVVDGTPPAETACALWFAWHAAHPETVVR